MTSRTVLAIATIACAAALHGGGRVREQRIVAFQKLNDALGVTLDGRAAPVRVPVARPDLVAISGRVADAYARGVPVAVELAGDELISIAGSDEDLTSRPFKCDVPPGPPVFGFGTVASGDVAVGTGSARQKVLRRANPLFAETVAKLAWAWKSGALSLQTSEVAFDAGTDEIVGICLPAR
jgi:hypothetical protein